MLALCGDSFSIGQVDGEWSIGDEFIERPLNDD